MNKAMRNLVNSISKSSQRIIDKTQAIASRSHSNREESEYDVSKSNELLRRNHQELFKKDKETLYEDFRQAKIEFKSQSSK